MDREASARLEPCFIECDSHYGYLDLRSAPAKTATLFAFAVPRAFPKESQAQGKGGSADEGEAASRQSFFKPIRGCRQVPFPATSCSTCLTDALLDKPSASQIHLHPKK